MKYMSRCQLATSGSTDGEGDDAHGAVQLSCHHEDGSPPPRPTVHGSEGSDWILVDAGVPLALCLHCVLSRISSALSG